MTMTALLSTVYYAVKAIVDPTILPERRPGAAADRDRARRHHRELRRIPPR